MLRAVELSNPHMITIAIGACISLPGSNGVLCKEIIWAACPVPPRIEAARNQGSIALLLCRHVVPPLPSIADITQQDSDVGFVPTAEAGSINSHASKSRQLRLQPMDEQSASAVLRQSRQSASGPSHSSLERNCLRRELRCCYLPRLSNMSRSK